MRFEMFSSEPIELYSNTVITQENSTRVCSPAKRTQHFAPLAAVFPPGARRLGSADWQLHYRLVLGIQVDGGVEGRADLLLSVHTTKLEVRSPS